MNLFVQEMRKAMKNAKFVDKSHTILLKSTNYRGFTKLFSGVMKLSSTVHVEFKWVTANLNNAATVNKIRDSQK